MKRNYLTGVAPKKLNSQRDFCAQPFLIVRHKNTDTTNFPSTYGNETFLFVVDWQLSNIDTNQIDQSKSQMKKNYSRVF